MLQVPRRNYCMAIERGTFKNRGPAYSDKGVTMRCARADQSTTTITLHYLTSGGATLRFALRKQEFLLPVVLVAKALKYASTTRVYLKCCCWACVDCYCFALLLVVTQKYLRQRNLRSCAARRQGEYLHCCAIGTAFTRFQEMVQCLNSRLDSHPPMA